MNYESNRLNTFSNWPSSALVDPIRIAKAGFFYTGQGVEVQCFSCGGKISEWNYGDQVMARHRRLDVNCPFVLDPLRSGNVALVLDQLCPGQADSTMGRSEPRELDSLNYGPDYGVTEEDEMYKSDALRLLSFVNWDDSSVSREALVSAGFYHAGEGRLRCAWCGGELARMRRLGALGEPLDVHLRYFPGCAHAEMLAARDAAARAASIGPPPASPPASPPALSPHTPPLLSPHSPPFEPQQPLTQTEGSVHNARVLSGSGTWRSLGVVGGAAGARHPEKSSLASRIGTYTNWPREGTQTPQAMAEAGFYYTGSEDQVRCFYCDGGLGKWEAGDAPWREHARWFPHCGYLLLVKGKEFVDRCKETGTQPVTRTVSADTGLSSTRRLNSESRVNFPVTESQVSDAMESVIASAALGAGLDAARVRRAIARRLRSTGLLFNTSEALIDAVLDDQLNEEAWSVSPHSQSQSQRLARDILAETLREFAPGSGIIPASNWDDRSESQPSRVLSPPRSPSPSPPAPSFTPAIVQHARIEREAGDRDGSPAPQRKPMSLEEENRQLREARLCKVCMDGEVSVVFLPCGHLVSCAQCGAGLCACPLCRARVQALVRAYLA